MRFIFSGIKKIYIPSTEFIVIIIAAAFTTILFSFNLHAVSIKIDKENQKIKEVKIAAANYSKKPEIKKIQETEKVGEDIPRTQQVWGVAEQINETTWTMKVGEDEKMATAEEIQIALNTYRNKKGVGSLEWDDGLAALAKKRADTFVSIGKLDEHAGFKAYVEEEGNMEKLGFWGMGENSSIGFKLEGVHLIEWIFAGDPPHENNQLDHSWTHVGIGVNGTAVDVIFGKK